MIDVGVTFKEAELEQRVEALEKAVGKIMTILSELNINGSPLVDKQGDLWVTEMLRTKGDGYGG